MPMTSSESRVTLDREALLSFYDDRDGAVVVNDRSEPLGASSGSHVSAISGLMGEDLVLGLLLEYLRNPLSLGRARPKTRIVSYTCPVKGTRKKLDAWLSNVDEGVAEAFKVEIKNWSSYSLGEQGAALKPTATEAGVIKTANERWARFEKAQFKVDGVTKVVGEVKAPQGVDPKAIVIPILAFWLPIAPDDGEGRCAPLHWAQIEGKSCLVFSASIHLRMLKTKTVSIEMPRLRDRLDALSHLLIDLKFST